METGLYALGILSILYYIFIVWYTKKWNSTFSWFWYVFAAVNFVLGLIVSKTPTLIDYILMGVFGACVLVFIAIEILILCAMVSLVPQKLNCIIVLGAQVRGGKVSGTLKRRLDRALRYLQQNPGTFCIVSGGRGKDEELSEAEAMAAYLKACGIEPERICMEDESKTTYENLKNSLSFFENIKQEKIGIVTSNFHIYRSMKLAKLLGYKKIYAIPARTNLIVFPNYMVREFFAMIATVIEYKRKNSSY